MFKIRFTCIIFIYNKLINLDSITNENNKKHNEKWPYIPDHLYRILIIGGSESGKTNTLLNVINEQNDIDKIYLHARDLNEPKYKILIKKRKDAGIKHLNDPNAFIDCSNTMDDVYENIQKKSGLFLMIWLQTLWQIKNFKP